MPLKGAEELSLREPLQKGLAETEGFREYRWKKAEIAAVCVFDCAQEWKSDKRIELVFIHNK